MFSTFHWLRWQPLAFTFPATSLETNPQQLLDHTIDAYHQYPPRPSSPQRSPQSPAIGKQAARSNSLGPTTLKSTEGHPSIHRSTRLQQPHCSQSSRYKPSKLSLQAQTPQLTSTVNTQFDARAEIHQLTFSSRPSQGTLWRATTSSRKPSSSRVKCPGPGV